MLICEEIHQDEVAEWLRRWTANPMCSARVGSNPILVANFYLPFLLGLGSLIPFFTQVSTKDEVTVAKGLVRDSNPGPLAP